MAESGASGVRRASTPESTETKASLKTSEFFIYVIAAVLVLIAGYVAEGFTETETWRYFTYLTIGYMISRGLAKAGSRDPYRD